MSEHDQLCEAHSNIQRNCYCQQRNERRYIESLEAERDRLKAEVKEVKRTLKEEIEFNGNVLDVKMHELSEDRDAWKAKFENIDHEYTLFKIKAEVESFNNESWVSAVEYGRLGKDCDAWKAKAEKLAGALRELHDQTPACRPECKAKATLAEWEKEMA